MSIKSKTSTLNKENTVRKSMESNSAVMIYNMMLQSEEVAVSK